MKNLSFLHPSSLELFSYMHITKHFHDFLKKTPQTLSAYTQQIQLLLQQIIPLPQISYAILSESVFLPECLEQSLTNFMNILIQVPHTKSLIIHSLSITIFRILKTGSPFSYMIALNVNAINTFI